MVNYRKRKIYCDALGSSKTPHISLKVLKSYSLCSLHRDKKTEHLFEIRAVWKTSLVFNVQHCYVINLIVYVMNTEMWMITLLYTLYIVPHFLLYKGWITTSFTHHQWNIFTAFGWVLLFFLFNPDTPGYKWIIIILHSRVTRTKRSQQKV